MPQCRGSFIWYDVMTNDTKVGSDFLYSRCRLELAARFPNAGTAPITLVASQGETMVGGLMQIPADAVRDGREARGRAIPRSTICPRAVGKRIVAAGGKITVEPTDIPNVVLFPLAADTGGAMFFIFKPLAATPAACADGAGFRRLARALMLVPRSRWIDAKPLRWTKERSMDMGRAMGVYQTFAASTASRAAV